MPDDDLNARIGARVAETRKLRGKTQQQLADVVGLGRTSIVNIEAGRGLSVETLVALAAALDVPVDVLTAPGVLSSPWLELAKVNTATERSYDDAANRSWQAGDVIEAMKHRYTAVGLRLAQVNQITVLQQSRRAAPADGAR